MYAKIKVMLLAVAMGVVGFAPSAFAVEEITATENQAPMEAQTMIEPVTTTEVMESKVEEKKKTMEERLQSYKEKQQQTLAEAQSKRIVARCKSAQVKVASLRTRVTTVVETRKAVYEKIDARLTELLVKLQKAGIVTTGYETAQKDIKVDLASLSESMETYGTVLDDLVAMDCAADPEAFKAALESARETQKELREKSQEFRLFATTQLKTIMQEVRAQLEVLTSETTTETTGGDQ
jgi:hypothetical protein